MSTEERAVPAELREFNWAAFLWGGIWALAHRVWLGLWAFVPVFGVIMHIYLGMRGAEWAWQKGGIPDVERFKRAQRNWVIAWLVLAAVSVPLLGVGSALAIYGVRQYITHAKRSEAPLALKRMAEGMVQCGAQGNLPETSNWVPAGQISAAKYQSMPSEWASEAAFSCAAFSLSQPQYFRYRWLRATSTSGRFEAEADLDGDGIADNAMRLGVQCSAGICSVQELSSELLGAQGE